ncbi:MAG TPA: translation elongation factor Ts, partial [Acidimicrobiia bacterium]|nr:translation elongation factor Ts [Acidimicrobiia bacterium]
MAEFSAKDIAALRKATGAGMLDCKQALEESDGKLDDAMDWLRAKGIAKAGKLSDREATEGAVDVVVDGNVG